jgi:RNA polymerase sigma-70 factor, ECF subfamily
MENTLHILHDEKIVTFIIKGDKNAFGILIERYEDKLSRYVRRFTQSDDDIMDILQVVFIKAYTNLQGFDTSRSFNSWIYLIAHNECVNYLKKKSGERVSFIDFDTILPHLFAEEESHTLAEKEETKKMLETLLGRISPKYREILILYYYDDLSYEEIGDVLQIPTSTVGVRIKRGKEALQKIVLDKNYHHDRS